MTYEEYLNEIEDFDDITKQELLADFQNHIPIDNPSMMQQMGYGGFQDFLKVKNEAQTMQLGETVRGMSNVSPLVAMKFGNQKSEEIKNKYFVDGKATQKGNTNVIEDINITVKNGYNFDTYNYYFDNNHNGKYGDGNDTLAFKLLLFISRDGNKVQECYEVVKPKDDEVILFLESDKDALSRDVLYGKMAKKVRKQFTDEKGNLKSNLFDNEIMKAVNKYANINQDVVEELMKNGYIENKSITEGFFTYLKYVMMGVSAPAKALGWILNKIGGWVDFLKVSDEFWDTEIEGYYFQKDQIIKALTIPTEKLKILRDIFTDKKGFDLGDLSPKFLDDIILSQINVMEAFIGRYNSYIKNKVEEIFQTPENPQLQEQTENLTEKVALLCGIWNGLVDFVASTLKFFGGLLAAPFDISKDFQHTLEMIDNFWDMLDATFFENLWSAIKEGVKQIVAYLKSKDSEEFNWVRINYAAGFTLSFIGTFFIPIADIAKISEIGKMGEILAKINEEIGKTISQTAKFVKIQTAEVYQKVSKALESVIELFKTGGQKLRDFVNNLWKKIADWFLKNKKLLLYEGAGKEIRSVLVKVVDIATDLAPVEIKQYEKWIIDFTDEWAGMITQDGRIIKNITSSKNKAVDLAKYGDDLVGAIVTHNHPSGNSLSTGDIRRFMFHGIKELRAIAKTDESVFVLRNLGEKLKISEIGEIQKAVVKALKGKNIPIDHNSLEVADLYIKEIMKQLDGRVEYIHYKKL